MAEQTVLDVKSLDTLFSGGTNHALENFANGNDFEYKIGEDITFSYTFNGDFIAKWAVYKDDPEDNAIPELGETGTNAHGTDWQKQISPVKKGVTAYGEKTLSVTTRMNKAGIVRFDILLCDKDGTPVKYDTTRTAFFTTIAVVDFDNIKQPLENGVGDGLPTSYIDASGKTVNKTTDEFLFDLREKGLAAAAPAEKCISENGEKIKNFIKSAELGSDISFGNTLYLKLIKKTDDCGYFAFRIATNDVVGTVSTGEDGLFNDPVYKKAAEVFGCPEYILRPAAGVFAIPYDLSAADTFSAHYHGYGTARALLDNGNPSRIMVNMNSHGMKDELDDDYIANIAAHTTDEGGNKQCMFSDLERAMTDPTHLYPYGIILRDFVAFLCGKAMYKLLKGERPKKIMSNGGSMGGWQSFMMSALDYDVDATYGDCIWMTTVGEETTNNYVSNFIPTGNPALYYYSTASAGAHISLTMDKRPSHYKLGLTGGLADHTSIISGIIGLYNNINGCPKSIEFRQFGEHGFYPVKGAPISFKCNTENGEHMLK